MKHTHLVGLMAVAMNLATCTAAHADHLYIHQGNLQRTFEGDIVGTLNFPGQQGLHILFMGVEVESTRLPPVSYARPPRGDWSWANEIEPPPGAPDFKGFFGPMFEPEIQQQGYNCRLIDFVNTQSDDDYATLECGP